MPNSLPNLYSPPSLPGMDPQASRVIRDLVERINYLTLEVDRVRGDIPGTMTFKAKKESPIPGIITIPHLSGNGFIRVNEDGVISSYTNPSSLPTGQVTTLFTGLSGAFAGSGTVTTNITTIRGGTIFGDGDYFEVIVFGRFISSANNKEIRLVLNQGGTQILCTTGAFTTGSPTLWEARATVRRDTASNLDSRAWGLKANAIYGQTELFTSSWNWSADFTVDMVTVTAAASEVSYDRSLIVKYPAI